MKHKRLIGIVTASALALSLTTTALATGSGPVAPGGAGNIQGGGGGIAPSPEEVAANGNTTIAIMQSKVDPHNVSFTVPLYVTMAVVDSSSDVTVPSNYVITNTSTVQGGSAADYKIGVTAMSFEKLSAAAESFNTIAYNATTPPPDAKSLMLTIGGVDMPAMDNLGVAPVDLSTTSQRNGHTTNKFWSGDAQNGKPNAIEIGTPLDLDLAGTVMATNRTASAAVAQFRVKYTISLLDQGTGKPLGWVYAGDDRTQAGLGKWTPPAP